MHLSLKKTRINFVTLNLIRWKIFYPGEKKKRILTELVQSLLDLTFSKSVSWGWRIHWLHFYRSGGGKTPHPPNESPRYDAKQFNGEALVMQELWGMQSTPLFQSLPGPLWPGVVAPDRVLSMCQMICFIFKPSAKKWHAKLNS